MMNAPKFWPFWPGASWIIVSKELCPTPRQMLWASLHPSHLCVFLTHVKTVQCSCIALHDCIVYLKLQQDTAHPHLRSFFHPFHSPPFPWTVPVLWCLHWFGTSCKWNIPPCPLWHRFLWCGCCLLTMVLYFRKQSGDLQGLINPILKFLQDSFCLCRRHVTSMRLSLTRGPYLSVPCRWGRKDWRARRMEGYRGFESNTSDDPQCPVWMAQALGLHHLLSSMLLSLIWELEWEEASEVIIGFLTLKHAQPSLRIHQVKGTQREMPAV